MYAWIWRKLPFGRWGKLTGSIGLIAAIPAVVAYNMLSRASGAVRAGLADGAAEVLRLLSRDHDRRLARRPLQAAAE